MSNAAVPTPSPNTTAPPRDEPRTRTVSPHVDVLENDSELLLVADVPGASPETVDVRVDKGQLTLAAHRPAAEGAPSAHGYHRVFSLPPGIDGSKIDAELTAGVLTVRLPKSDAHKPRRIDVRAS